MGNASLSLDGNVLDLGKVNTDVDKSNPSGYMNESQKTTLTDLENKTSENSQQTSIPTKIENERKDNCTKAEEIEIKTSKGQRIEVKQFEHVSATPEKHAKKMGSMTKRDFDPSLQEPKSKKEKERQKKLEEIEKRIAEQTRKLNGESNSPSRKARAIENLLDLPKPAQIEETELESRNSDLVHIEREKEIVDLVVSTSKAVLKRNRTLEVTDDLMQVVEKTFKKEERRKKREKKQRIISEAMKLLKDYASIKDTGAESESETESEEVLRPKIEELMKNLQQLSQNDEKSRRSRSQPRSIQMHSRSDSCSSQKSAQSVGWLQKRNSIELDDSFLESLSKSGSFKESTLAGNENRPSRKKNLTNPTSESLSITGSFKERNNSMLVADILYSKHPLAQLQS